MYGVVAVTGTMNCAVALPGTSVMTPVTLRYSASRRLPLPVTVVGSRVIALDTTMPMDGTTAPNVSTETGVASGASWSRFSPVANEKVSLVTTPKSGADTFTFVPH